MKILIAGGTGFVGQHLIPALLKEHHQITVVGRDSKKIQAIFNQTVTALPWEQLNTQSPDDYAAVINLTGENIGAHRWTEKVKQRVIDSRVTATSTLVNWCLRAKQNKPHLYNTSAIGVYGLQAVTPTLPKAFTESAPLSQATDFLSTVGRAWEQAVQPGIQAGLPVTIMRFGVVLKRHEGMLKKLEPSFQFGMGAILGSGNQAITWIHVNDLVKAILFLLQHAEIVGPINLCAPQCVTQWEFSKALAQAMKRPLFLTMPAFVVKILFGQMGEELLLSGQNVYPERLLQAGFQFSYPELQTAIKE